MNTTLTLHYALVISLFYYSDALKSTVCSSAFSLLLNNPNPEADPRASSELNVF